jgi:NADH-quinone oxidoreductase subunit C
MSATLERDLGALTPPVTAADGDYARTGFHHEYAVDAPAMPGLARVFADHGYFLEMIACLDLRPTDGRMRLIYTFNRFEAADRHRVHVDLAPTVPWTGPEPKPARKAPAAEGSDGSAPPDAGPTHTTAPSIVDIFPAADWMEREVFDMHGVRFDDHPDLERILLPEDADFHALLKDFGRIEDAEGGDE